MTSLRLAKRVLQLQTKSIGEYCRFYSEFKKPIPENPVKRTARILGNDLKGLAASLTGRKFTPKKYDGDGSIIRFSDVVIIGGGVIGSSIAYYLREMSGMALDVTVIEKDPTYKEASTVLSVGGLRQQFSLPENILMSQYAAEFFRDIKTHLGQHVDLQFTPHGYLILATEETAALLEKNYKVQREYNVKNELLGASQLKKLYPWLNTNDIVMGCRGLENEGWFDPWSLLLGFKNRAIEMGARYEHAEVIGFEFEEQPTLLAEGVEVGKLQRPYALHVKTPDGKPGRIEFAIAIVAAGAKSGQITQLANIGRKDMNPMLQFKLPVEPRKRFVYCFQCADPNPPGLNTPMVFDQSGTYFRREGLGNTFIGGRAPSPADEPDISNLDVDYNFFDTHIWPHLANRVPAFNNIKVNGGWAGYYEFNNIDENGIIGSHPFYKNIIMATGFSGHGIQQAPAVGRGVAEYILEGSYVTINLVRLGFDRFLTGDYMYESNIF